MNETLPVQEKMNLKWVRLFLPWIGVNLFAWAVWLLLATSLVFVGLQSSDFLSFAALFLVGVGMGILQGLLISRPFSINWFGWAILTTIGFTIGFISLIWAALQDHYIVFSPPGSPVLEWDTLLGGALLGLAVGCFQSVCWLPRLGRVALWIGANILGWSLGMFLPQLIAFQSASAGTPWLSSLWPVVISAMITGVVLVLWNHQKARLTGRPMT